MIATATPDQALRSTVRPSHWADRLTACPVVLHPCRSCRSCRQGFADLDLRSVRWGRARAVPEVLLCGYARVLVWPAPAIGPTFLHPRQRMPDQCTLKKYSIKTGSAYMSLLLCIFKVRTNSTRSCYIPQSHSTRSVISTCQLR